MRLLSGLRQLRHGLLAAVLLSLAFTLLMLARQPDPHHRPESAAAGSGVHLPPPMSNGSTATSRGPAAGVRCELNRVSGAADGVPCPEASRRGAGQSVISYSLFQTDDTGSVWDNLLTGLDENAALAGRLYAGWRLRVHHDTAADSPRRRRLAQVACRHRNVDLCYISRPPDVPRAGVYVGALWRFFPLTDDLVKVFVSRDLDSRLSQREADAVAAWMATNKTFHIMRDHWEHLMTMPGGLWGAKVEQRRDLMTKLGRQLAKWLHHSGHKNWDQRALQSVVWWDAAVDSLQHDSYTCQRFPGYTVPFPTRRSASDTALFLGQVVDTRHNGTAETLLKCPPTCRPPEHQDWEYC